MSALLTGGQLGFDGHLNAQIKSEAISAQPLRSRYQADMQLVVTRGGKETLLNVNTRINGEYDGSPTGGMVDALNRLIDAINLAGRPVEKLHGPATSP